MSTMPEGKEVAYYKFITTKNDRDFCYEMRLLRFDPTQEYCFMRRWYYTDVSERPLWKHGSWNKRNNLAFDRKVVQKRDIMGYQLIEQNDRR